jgi:Alg9-like mannosyltransferase family
MSMEASEQSLASSDASSALAASVHRLRRRARSQATSQNVLLFLVAFRIVNALSVRTFFQPDEFFQSLEPAWQVAFGRDSGAWITWVSAFSFNCRLYTGRKATERCCCVFRNGNMNYDPLSIPYSLPPFIISSDRLRGSRDCPP